jgi:hypothetical protein
MSAWMLIDDAQYETYKAAINKAHETKTGSLQTRTLDVIKETKDLLIYYDQSKCSGPPPPKHQHKKLRDWREKNKAYLSAPIVYPEAALGVLCGLPFNKNIKRDQIVQLTWKSYAYYNRKNVTAPYPAKGSEAEKQEWKRVNSNHITQLQCYPYLSVAVRFGGLDVHKVEDVGCFSEILESKYANYGQDQMYKYTGFPVYRGGVSDKGEPYVIKMELGQPDVRMGLPRPDDEGKGLTRDEVERLFKFKDSLTDKMQKVSLDDDDDHKQVVKECKAVEIELPAEPTTTTKT